MSYVVARLGYDADSTPVATVSTPATPFHFVKFAAVSQWLDERPLHTRYWISFVADSKQRAKLTYLFCGDTYTGKPVDATPHRTVARHVPPACRFELTLPIAFDTLPA